MELTFKHQMQECRKIAQQINEANQVDIDASDVWRGLYGAQQVVQFEPPNRKTYINGLKRFWIKKLKHIKKPTIKKRKIVDRYVFATIQTHKQNRLPNKSNLLQ